MSPIVFTALFLLIVTVGAYATTNTFPSGDSLFTAVTCESTGQHLAAATSDRTYFSSDSGISWFASDAPSDYYTSMSMDPSANNYVAAASLYGDVLLSINYGRNWADITGALNIGQAVDGGVSVANGGQTVIIIENYVSPNECVFITQDAGETWSGPLGPVISTSEDCIAAALNGAGDLIVLSVENFGLYVSSDHGVSWEIAYSYEFNNVYSILYNPSLAVFYASLSGMKGEDYPVLIKSDSTAMQWTVLPGALPVSSRFDPMGLGVSSIGDKIVIADADVYCSTDSGVTYYKAFEVADVAYFSCMSGDASLVAYATLYALYTTDTLPAAPTDDDDDSLVNLSCSDSPCPTDCPYGYSGGYESSSCTVYCKSQPTDGQCLPGGSGCDSSCRTAGELAGIIIGAVLGFLLIVGLIIFCCRKCCCERPPAMAKCEETAPDCKSKI